MIRFIATRRYKGTALSGEYLNIHYGEQLEERDGTLYWHEEPVCLAESDNGFMHFSWDGDGRGKERGKLTYAIAYGNDGKAHAFSDDENELMRSKWSKYLRSLSDANIVNPAFFKAPVDVLKEIASDLHFVSRKNKYYYRGSGPSSPTPPTGGNADVRYCVGRDDSSFLRQTGLHDIGIPERDSAAD